MNRAHRNARPGGGKPEVFLTLEAEEQRPGFQDLPEIKLAEFRHRKWRAIHKYLSENPFNISVALPRARQWRAVLDHTRTLFYETEIIDWLLVQIHIAENLARGIRDMRPRKNGPCYDVFMEYVRDRKHKMHVVHRWLQDAEGQGSPMEWHVPPQMGLKSQDDDNTG